MEQINIVEKTSLTKEVEYLILKLMNLHLLVMFCNNDGAAHLWLRLFMKAMHCGLETVDCLCFAFVMRRSVMHDFFRFLWSGLLRCGARFPQGAQVLCILT